MLKRGLESTDGRMARSANLTLAGTASHSSSAAADPSSLGLLEAPPLEVVGEPPPVRAEGWVHRYQAQLVAIDVLAGSAAAALGFLGRFGGAQPVDGSRADVGFALGLPLAWVAVIALNRAYEGHLVGVGPTEFERVFRAFLHLSVLTGFAAYAFKLDVARGFIVVALPLALVLDLIGRQLARGGLKRDRARGKSMSPVLAVGGPESVARFVQAVNKDQYAGMRVVGACTPPMGVTDTDTFEELTSAGVPVLGDVDSIRESVRQCGAHIVAVLAGEIDGEKLRWISWQLEGTDTDLVLSPGLSEIGGQRLHVQPIRGLPLLHVSEPEFAGFRHVLKGAFDRIAAGLALVLLSPLLIGIALLVRLTSTGPALFFQTRVGKGGKQFRMVKFRSMHNGAERRVSELVSNNEAADGLLFKIRDDPRVTRIGRTLRRFSLDELPQLINVLSGSMSMVGPRPPLPTEVARYGDDLRRRLLVKPGLTGLWQISGRSDLSWEESVRLDLHYVENWSLATDLFILCRTFRAVIRSSGAY